MSQKIPDLILYTTKSPSRYSETQPEILDYIKNNSSVECRQVIDLIKKIIKDKKTPPSQKVLALDLFHSCMMSRRPDFIQISESRMSSLFTRLAQKTSQTIFFDSNDNYENRQSSEQFLSNLLNYFYIWANELNGANGKKKNEFNRIFLKIRDIVNFSYRPRASLVPIKENDEDTESLKKTLGILEVLESMSEPQKEEIGKEMIQSLFSSWGGLQMSLEQSIKEKKKKVSEKILKVMKRVKRFTGEIRKSPARTEKEVFKGRLSVPDYQNLETCDLRIENQELRERLNENEEIIKNLNSTILSLQGKIKALEESYSRTKDLLYSKEQECAECHEVKSQFRTSVNQIEYKELMSFAKNNFYTDNLKLPVMFQSLSSPPVLPESRNEEMDNFKLACCGRSDLLFENQMIKVTFYCELKEVFLIVLEVKNIGSAALSNVESEIDKSFGYDITLLENNLVELKPTQSTIFQLHIKQLCVTGLFPSISIKFDKNEQFLECTFQIPVHMASFSVPISFTQEQLLNDFELLAFDSDSKSVKCLHSLRRCRKLLRLSVNSKIFTRKNLRNLQECQIFSVYLISKLVYCLLSLNIVGQIASIEIRGENQSTRQDMANLIIYQLS